MTAMDRTDLHELLEDIAEQSIDSISDALEGGYIGEADARELVIDVVSLVVDAIIPTGKLDPVDDAIIRSGISAAVQSIERVVSDLGVTLRRDPARIRARAQRARDRGHGRVAERRERRAARVESRRD